MNRILSALLHALAALGCALLPCLVAWSAHAAETTEKATQTAPRPPLKVAAYFEAGPYWEFSVLRQQIITALKDRGVLEHIDFPADRHISPGWDATDDTYRSAARKLMQDPSVDVILSMGTTATKALLAENNGRTPIMSIDVADPVGAGIVDRRTGKTAPNLTIHYVKDKWYKVFALFHEALPFKRLGIMYHDSPEGLSYSNVHEAREVARERGFTLVEYPRLDKAESGATCAQGVDELLRQGIDAFYISALNCFDWTQENPQPMFDALSSHGIRTFARDGSVHVRRGALMGLSTLDYVPLGRFYADRMAQRLGLLPPTAELERETYTPKITLNLVTANNLGMDIPLLLLISSDEIFDATLVGAQNATMPR
ncbi:MAG TPA: ABC transporter substrate binding protein [Nitratidesulfovibrio sp.]|nr:ABC transporter substrate binding protein [Nitratidesulfovibrio sp.]